MIARGVVGDERRRVGVGAVDQDLHLAACGRASMSRAKPGSTRTTACTSPRSSSALHVLLRLSRRRHDVEAAATREALAQVAALRACGPGPSRRCARGPRPGSRRSRRSAAASAAARRAAPRMRGSRSVWRNSLRTIWRMRSHMSSRQLLAQLARRQQEDQQRRRRPGTGSSRPQHVRSRRPSGRCPSGS